MAAPEKPVVAVIAGATATGKSDIALALAEATGGVIINADASQLYADLEMLSARPGPADTARVPHRLYGTVDGAVAYSAAGWSDLARAEINAALTAGRLPIMVGGTGLYLRTLLSGIAAVPAVPAAVRDAVRALDPAAARAALEAQDPEAATRLHPADRQRTLRALEVVRATGRTLAEWQTAATGGIAATHRIVATVIERDRDDLYRRCDARVDGMLAGGALLEVERLLARALPADRPVLRAIGVAPLAEHLAGRISLAEARARIAQDTRHYAKRQSTWWRNQTPDWPRLNGEAPVAELSSEMQRSLSLHC